jgi:hypothetical protein
LNKVITANYRRLPDLFRRPPPIYSELVRPELVEWVESTKQIASANLHYYIILPHILVSVNTKF